MKKFGHFNYERISERVTRISGITGELMYLVEGNQRAALIDTGTGVGSLKALVTSLTDKPCFAILTHGHVDHAMGASEFDEVYLNPADKGVFTAHSGASVREEYLKMSLHEKLADIAADDYIPAAAYDTFQPVLPGDTFDLGGIKLEICVGAGHTAGMITILLVEERTLLLGDACNFFTFLFDEFSLGVTSYEKNLFELEKQTRGRYDKVYLSHGDGDAPKDMISSVIQVCEDIKSNQADDIPFNFMGNKAFIAKAIDPNDPVKRVDGGLGNILYSKEKVDL